MNAKSGIYKSHNLNQGFDADPPEYKLVNETADKKAKYQRCNNDSCRGNFYLHIRNSNKSFFHQHDW